MDSESDSGDEEVMTTGFGLPEKEQIKSTYYPSDSGEEEVMTTGFGLPESEHYPSDSDTVEVDQELDLPDEPEDDYSTLGQYFNTDMTHDTKPVYKTKTNILKNVGAIGIFTHGRYDDTHTFIPIPKGLVVNEYNSAPDSCYIHGPIFKEDDSYCYRLTKKAVSDLSGCMNKTDYMKTIGNVTKPTPNMYPELSCNLYLKVKDLKGKIYSITPVETKIKEDVVRMDYSNIIFMVAIHESLDDEGNQMYKKVNLSLCNVDELKDFFKLTPDSRVYNEDKIEQFIMDRDYTDNITTTQLVMLSSFATLELNLGHLNILDTSCSPRLVARPGLRTDKYGYRLVMHNARYRDPNFVTSHGTKRKRNASPDISKSRTKTRKPSTKTRKSKTRTSRTSKRI